MTSSLGIPCISFGQKRATRMLLNASTVATFFAGVAGKHRLESKDLG